MLDGKANQLQLEKSEKPAYIFWVENQKTIKSMNINSTEIVELEMPSDVYIVAAENENTESGTFAFQFPLLSLISKVPL